MMHITPEGSKLKAGVNFYPLSEYRYSIGFRIKTSKGVFRFRYAPRINKFYFGIW